MANENRELAAVDHQTTPLIVALFYRLIDGFEIGHVTLKINGTCYYKGGSQNGPTAQIELHNPGRVLRKIWSDGGLGFAESYIAGDWESQDLSNLLYWAALNLDSLQKLKKTSPLKHLLGRLYHMMKSNTRKGSRKNIAAHYDLGNDFYQLWLDETMTYSSAIFDHPAESLSSAQERKYSRLLNQLGARAGDHILEIGCGWGGFAEHAAKQGIRVTGVTLSQEQLDYANDRIRNARLQHLVELRLQDYRDISESYDHVVSIEMFEAVGEAYWPTYFEAVHQRLKPGGRAAIQVITIREDCFDHYRTHSDFIQRYIFPGGMLPTPTLFNQHAASAGFSIRKQDSFGHDYALTLMQWHEQFNRRIYDIREEGFSDEFIRMWKFYLSYCEAGFRHGRIDLYQTTLEKSRGAH